MLVNKWLAQSPSPEADATGFFTDSFTFVINVGALCAALASMFFLVLQTYKGYKRAKENSAHREAQRIMPLVQSAVRTEVKVLMEEHERHLEWSDRVYAEYLTWRGGIDAKLEGRVK